MMLVGGVFPYGNSTALFSDSFSQIAPFLEHIFRWLKGESSLIYYSGLAGGTEILSTLIYMLICPFYIVLLLFGENNIMQSFSLALFLIFVFDAFVFLWFSKKYFKKLKLHTRILFTLIFTFSGYMCFNYGFITWLVYPGITLLLIDAFLKLVNSKKIARFICLLVWYVATSFGVGVSSNLILILLFFGYIFFTKDKEERGGACLRLVIAYIAAILASLVILSPAIFAMLGSERNSELIGNLFNKSDYNLIEYKLAGLFMETSIMVFAVCYLVKCNKKEKLNKFFFFALAVLFIPVVFDVCQKLLCGSIYLAFAFRFTFLNTILLFILAMKYFEYLNEKFEETEEVKSQFLFKFLNIFIIVVFAVGLIFFEIMGGKSVSGIIKNPNTTGKSIVLYLCISALFMLCFVFSRIGLWRKILSTKMLKITLTAILSITLVFNFCGMSLNMAENGNDLKKATTFVRSQNLSGNLKKFCLSEDFSQINTHSYGVNQYDYFSSLIAPETINSFKALGYYGGVTFVEVIDNNFIADSLMGNNIYLSSMQHDRPYLSLIAEQDGLYLYKNELATTGAVVLPENFAFDDNKTIFENFQALAESFGIENEMLFNDVSVSFGEHKYDEKNKIHFQKISFTADIDCILQINSIIRYGQLDSYTKKDEMLGDDDYIIIDSVGGTEGTDIGFVGAGKTRELYVCYTKENLMDKVKFTALNYSAASSLCEKLQENQVELERTKTGFEVKGELQSKGRLFVSSPNIKGLNFLVNGESVNSIKAIGDFACFDLEAGKVELVATYSYPHALAWIIISVLAIVLLVALMLVYKYVNLAVLEKPAYIGMMVLCAVDVLIFYVIGIIISVIFIIKCLI